VNERALLAWRTGGGIAREPVIELEELVRETGGGDSREILRCFGGGIEVPTGSMSTVDMVPTTLPEDERRLPGRFGGTGGGTLWITGVRGASDGEAAWEGVGSRLK